MAGTLAGCDEPAGTEGSAAEGAEAGAPARDEASCSVMGGANSFFCDACEQGYWSAEATFRAAAVMDRSSTSTVISAYFSYSGRRSS